ncbi:unnamed protein product [Urochloa humidicola]
MECGSAPSAWLLDGLGTKQKEVKRKEDEEREELEEYIEDLRVHDELEGTKTMPPSGIVKYYDLVEKAWGWDKLLPFTGVPWSDYSKYLDEYYLQNALRFVPGAAPTTGSSIAALAEMCLKKEEQLASEWKIHMNSKTDMILPSKSIILSCLIHQRARSVIRAAGCKFSDVSSAALLCIAKEADLICELLRRGASPSDDYLIDLSSEIRMCALSLMNCTSCHSVAASAAMLGVSKEAETMCKWMSENNMLLDIFDVIPEDLADGRRVRFLTLYVMIDILEKSSSAAAAGNKIDKQESASKNGPGGDGNGIAADEAATITGISDVLDSQDLKKIKDLKISGVFPEKAWGWERLVPLYDGSVTRSDYNNYLVEYYNRNAFKFVAEAAGNQNPDWLLDPADQAVAKSCLEMEEELLSEWKNHVTNIPDKILPVNTLIQSSLIKERALSISGDKPFVPSTIAFVCITKEADLTHELLKHGAKPTDDMIEQSSVIRMFALGLVNIKGCQSIASAAAMVGMAKEAKMMCDWMKRENKLLTFNMSEHPELEVGRFIRNRTLDVMISVLQESSFPSSKILDDAMARDSRE